MNQKVKSYSEDVIYLADIAKALSHPARIQILRILCNIQDCVCGDIVDQLPLSQSTVSQHLKELKRVGLIQGEIEGPRTCYCINSQTLAKVQEKFNSLFLDICNCNNKCNVKGDC